MQGNPSLGFMLCDWDCLQMAIFCVVCCQWRWDWRFLFLDCGLYGRVALRVIFLLPNWQVDALIRVMMELKVFNTFNSTVSSLNNSLHQVFKQTTLLIHSFEPPSWTSILNTLANIKMAITSIFLLTVLLAASSNALEEAHRARAVDVLDKRTGLSGGWALINPSCPADTVTCDSFCCSTGSECNRNGYGNHCCPTGS